MSNLNNDYELGVGKTVLELFKKVLQVRNDHNSSENTKKNINQTGGSAVDATPAVDAVVPSAAPASAAAVETKTNDTDSNMVNLTLTKVEQYYDGTIYEGSINLSDKEMVLFNIKDRTKGHYESSEAQL
jgi:hypothetical protein